MAYEFKFPDIGEGITEGELLSWKVKEGDQVAQDQTLAEMETDKAVVEMPSPRAGTVLKLHCGRRGHRERGRRAGDYRGGRARPGGGACSRAPQAAPAAPSPAASASRAARDGPPGGGPRAGRRPGAGEAQEAVPYTGSVVGQLEEAPEEEEEARAPAAAPRAAPPSAAGGGDPGHAFGEGPGQGTRGRPQRPAGHRARWPHHQAGRRRHGSGGRVWRRRAGGAAAATAPELASGPGSRPLRRLRPPRGRRPCAREEVPLAPIMGAHRGRRLRTGGAGAVPRRAAEHGPAHGGSGGQAGPGDHHGRGRRHHPQAHPGERAHAGRRARHPAHLSRVRGQGLHRVPQALPPAQRGARRIRRGVPAQAVLQHRHRHRHEVRADGAEHQGRRPQEHLPDRRGDRGPGRPGRRAQDRPAGVPRRHLQHQQLRGHRQPVRHAGHQLSRGGHPGDGPGPGDSRRPRRQDRHPADAARWRSRSITGWWTAPRRPASSIWSSATCRTPTCCFWKEPETDAEPLASLDCEGPLGGHARLRGGPAGGHRHRSRLAGSRPSRWRGVPGGRQADPRRGVGAARAARSGRIGRGGAAWRWRSAAWTR